MYFVSILNLDTDEITTYNFESLFECEDFASNYPYSEDEEISIGCDNFAMDWVDYLSLRF